MDDETICKAMVYLAGHLLKDFYNISEQYYDIMHKLSNGNEDKILFSYAVANDNIIEELDEILSISPDFRYFDDKLSSNMSFDQIMNYINQVENRNDCQSNMSYRFIFRDTIYFSDDNLSENNGVMYKLVMRKSDYKGDDKDET